MDSGTLQYKISFNEDESEAVVLVALAAASLVSVIRRSFVGRRVVRRRRRCTVWPTVPHGVVDVFRHPCRDRSRQPLGARRSSR